MKQDPNTTIAPPIPGQWHWLPDSTRLVLKARLQTVDYAPLTFSSLAAVRVCARPFYPGWMLCDWQCDDDGFVWASLLYGPDGFTPLDGTALPMHEHNGQHGVILETERETLSYLRFFTWFVRGNDLPFELVDSADRLHSMDGELGQQQLASLCITPQAMMDQTTHQAASPQWRCSVLFGNALFHSVFSIATSGAVEMVSDETVATNIERHPTLRFDGCMRSDITPGPDDHQPAGKQQRHCDTNCNRPSAATHARWHIDTSRPGNCPTNSSAKACSSAGRWRASTRVSRWVFHTAIRIVHRRLATSIRC